jgi:SPOR domain
MSMADDNTVRSYRSNDRRNAQPAEQQDTMFSGSDPLAELARLIGQTDPYADTGRGQPQGAAPRAAHRDDPGAGDWRKLVRRPTYDERPSYETREEPPFDLDARHAAAEPHTGYADHDPYRMPSQHYEDRYADQQRADYDPHADYRRDLDADDYRHDRSYAAAAPNDYPDEQMYADPHHRRQAGEHDHGDLNHGDLAAHADETYDDPPRRRKTGSSLVTAVVLIGCAMLGTAGAYGYRTYATASGSKQAPVITADNSPSKVVPAEQKSARSQDRVALQSGDERLVSREEQPVSLQSPSNSAVPRIQFPSPVQSAPSTTGTTSSASQANAVDQPKRVRTVPIRPEGGDTSSRPNGESRSAPPPPAARTAPPPQSRTSRDQPMSLDPNAPAQEPARSQQRAPEPAARVAAVPPPSTGGAGGYLVQVSSQRSEADAQASYRGLQTKYSQLKSHQPIIRRADLGTKGTYYRAMVGPFESGDEAVQFCNGLKQAGGQCIIHRN